MNKVLLIVRKDLLRRMRSPLGVLVMLAFPLIFAGIFGIAFGGEDGPSIRARLLVEDLDDGLASGLLRSALTSDQLSQLLEVVEVGDEGRQLMEDGEASALLRIPENTTQKLLEGESVRFELIRNPAQTVLPEIAEQVVVLLTDVLDLAARLVRNEAEALGMSDLQSIGDLQDADFARLALRMRSSAQVARRYVESPPLQLEVVTLGDDGLPIAEGDPDESGSGEEDSEGENPARSVFVLLYMLPGVGVYALFMIGDQMMRDVVTEAKAGTLRRQLCAPLTVAHVIAAKVLVTALVSMVALLILASVAAFLSPDPVDLLGFAAAALALVLAVTGSSTLIYGVVENDQQASAFSGFVYLMLAFAGGSFLPFDQLPALMQAIAPISPFYWGTRAFRELLSEASWLDILGPVAILATIGIVFLVLGSHLLQRRVMRGGVA